MPKTLRIPPFVRDFKTFYINKTVPDKLFPIEFSENISVNFPYTIPANSEFSFTYTFPEKPSEVLIRDVYRFGDSSTNSTDYNLRSLKFGRVLVDLLLENQVHLSDGTQTKLFYWTPDGESDQYADTVDSENLLGYSTGSKTGHICHNSAINKNIVLKGYTIEENVLKMTFYNEESTPIVLDDFVTLEPKNTPERDFSSSTTFQENGMCVFGNKILSFGNKFIIRDSGGQWVSDKSSNIFVTESKYNSLEYTLGSKTTIMSPEHAFVTIDQGSMDSNVTSILGTTSNDTDIYNFGVGACVKDGAADEYFAAFMVGNIENSDMRFLLYDSELGNWDLKNSTSFDNSQSSIYTAHGSNLYDPQVGKKPMDIKHFSSSGNVHAMVSGYTDVYKPVIIYSNTNMETWTTIFDNSKLTSAVNSNVVNGNQVTNPLSAADDINKCLYSKMIDENTMFSSFCTYITLYDSGPGGDISAIQYLLKTDDIGSTWTDVHQSNPEYTLSETVSNYISDDGQRIYSMIFYQGNLYSNGSPYKILFNYSTNGGTTWRYPSRAWKTIKESSDTNSNNIAWKFMWNAFNNTNASYLNQRRSSLCDIYHNNNTNEIFVVYPVYDSNTNTNIYELLVSRDDGVTWTNTLSPAVENFEKYPSTVFGSLDNNLRHNLTTYQNMSAVPPHICSSNDLFAAFNLYFERDVEVNTVPYTVHDYIFESTSLGYTSLPVTTAENKLHNSALFVTHTNKSAKIQKIKGYYI